MSFPSLVGSQFGYQKAVPIPALPNQPQPINNIPTLALSVVLAGGLWICNVNRLEAVADAFSTGDRLNNYRVAIYYGEIPPTTPAPNIISTASIIGDTVYSIDLPTICIIKTDGVTPISIGIYAATTQGGGWSCDGGDAVFTRLY